VRNPCIFEWIEPWYHLWRPHRYCGMRSPADYAGSIRLPSPRHDQPDPICPRKRRMHN
jgi:hypothetical protein